jgi:GxxExxY protein
MTENEIGQIVVDAAIAVHRALGPGLLETVYEVALSHELQQRGLKVERQVPIPIEYSGVKFDEAFRADVIVEGKVILEMKSEVSHRLLEMEAMASPAAGRLTKRRPPNECGPR